MQRAALFTAFSVLVPGGLAGCGDDASLDRTIATVEVVRGEVHIGELEVAGTGRAAAESVHVTEGSLARLSLDSGPRLLIDAMADVVVNDEASVHLSGGRVFVEVGDGEVLSIETDVGTIRAQDAALSAALDEALDVYVVRGEVSWCVGGACEHVAAGNRVTAGEGDATIEPVTLWHDWTGGLARPGPGDADGSAGVGVLEARVPDEVGLARWPLVIRRLDVGVRIVGDLAVTEVEQVFFNPASETVEGTYRVRVPEEAVLQRFAVDRHGRMVDGYVKEKAQARAQYEAQVYRGSTLDPALLEWVAPGRYQARIYPIQPGETRRIVIRYAEWLAPEREGAPRLYRYRMGAGRDAPRIQEMSIVVDLDEAGVENVRAGMGAAIEEGRVALRRSDFAPRSDFWLELDGDTSAQRAWRAPHEPPPRAPDASAVPGEADERDYWYLPLRLPEALFADAAREGMDLVIVTDVSAATDRAHLELGRSVAEALTAHLGEDDRVALVTSDLTIRPLGEGDEPLGPAQGPRLEALLDSLARAPAGGATDLGAAIGAAAGLLDPARAGAVIYVGDGAPTVGELEAEGLLERLARLPSPLRLYAVGIGGDANLELLEVITRGGGLAMRVEERAAAADAALSILAHVSRPVAQRVTVDLGTGIENVYPRRPVDSVLGEVLPVVGRVRGEPPTEVVVRATIAGVEHEERIAVATQPTEQSTDLRLRWASERLRQLLLEGAQREEVAELGTRYGMITPFTSYYVPSAQELGQMGASALPWMDRPSLLAERPRRDGSWGDVIGAIVLAPLSIAGCTLSDEPEAVGSAVVEEALPAPAEVAQEERGEMGAPTPQAVVPSPPPTTTAAPNAALRRVIDMPAPDPAPAEPSDPLAGQDAFDPAVAEAPGGLAALGTIGRGAGGGGSAQGDGAAERNVDEPDPSWRPPRAPVGGHREGASRHARPRRMVATADSEGRLFAPPRPAPDDRFEADATTEARGPGNERLDASRDRGGDDEDGDSQRAQDGWFATGATVRVTITEEGRPAHVVRRCSDAASLSLADRRELWGERIGAAGHPHGWLGVYRQAIRDCEAPSWRDRRALLGEIVARAGSVASMISVYHLFDTGSARGFLRAAILRRVRSPEDLRAVRGAFGMGREPDWALVEQVLERARDGEARIRALRRISMQFPESFDLALRLLEALEVEDHGAEARRLAARLRVDPRADAGVRTAVGEMYLRMGMEDEARRVFSEIVEFAPLDELARRRLGDLYRAHGWFDDAYRQYQTLASIRPDDPSALLLLAQAAAGTGRIDEALRLEQRLMETAQPGAEHGIARVAQLWTSVRLAKLRAEARASDDAARLDAVDRRMRRSGVLSGAGDLRVTLVYAHPDAQLALYAAHPDTSLARPREIAPEHGIEAFDVPEQEDGAYRFEVRRADPDSPTDMQAELVVVWHEGREDEVVRVVPLTFEDGRDAYAWTLTDGALTEGT